MEFYDKPGLDGRSSTLILLLQGRAFAEFETYLVGVDEQGNVVSSFAHVWGANFRWRWTSALVGEDDSVILGNADPELGGGGTAEFLGFIAPSDITAERRHWLESLEAIDSDGDGVIDDVDNCVSTPNPDQQDTDGEGQGNACDADDDGDGVDDEADNCSLVPNGDQTDFDNDGQGDACDADVDGDGLNDAEDQCLGTAPGDVTDTVGCSIAQLCPCENPSGWKNHGEYVKCVAHASEDFLDLGLITEARKDATVSAAGEAQCGQKK